MSEPIVLITTHRIKEGKLDGLKQVSSEVLKSLEAGKPKTVFQYAYINEEGTEATFVHVFPDAAGMELHFEGVDERTKKAYEFLQPQRFEIYGLPSDRILDAMRQEAGSEIQLIVKTQSLGGFIRLSG